MDLAILTEPSLDFGAFLDLRADHGHMDLDPSRVLDNLERAPKDFSELAREIRNWLESQPA